MVHKLRLMPHQIVIDVVFVIWCLIKYTFFVCTSVKMKVIYLVVLVIYIHVKIIQQYFLSSMTIFGYEVWINVYKKISGCFYHNDCTDEQYTCISLITC